MINVLRKCWTEVELFYKSDSISSERSLQGELYRSLSSHRIDSSDKVLIEPSLGNYIPDIIVVSSGIVRCIIEIKFAPHWWVTGPELKKDIQKLIEYSKMDEFEPVIFGPSRVFDTAKKVWHGKKTVYSIAKDTVYCFASITRGEAPSSNMKSLKDYVPIVSELKPFCLLAGAISVDEQSFTSTSRFTIEENQ